MQVISTDLNYATLELLQLLLSWQERAKAANPLQASGHKRVVSGLRCAGRLLWGRVRAVHKRTTPLQACGHKRVVLGLRCAGRLL